LATIFQATILLATTFKSVIPSEARNPLFLRRRGHVMNLSDWRRRIDEIDKKLVELLNERSHCALEIGKLKQAANIPLYQPDRENEVLANAERANPGPLTDAAIRRLFERIIDEARAAERNAMHADGAKEKNLKQGN
jgi:chorismate mutase